MKCAQLDTYARNYDKQLLYASNYDKHLSYMVNEFILRIFFYPKLREYQSVLDLGCGTGRVSLRLAKTSMEVVATDVSIYMLRIARMKAARLQCPNILFVLCSACMLPFRTDSFNAVISCGTLHHLKEVKTACEGLYRVLKMGGRFYAYECGRNNPLLKSESYHPSSNEIRRIKSILQQIGIMLTVTPLVGLPVFKDYVIIDGRKVCEGESAHTERQVIIQGEVVIDGEHRQRIEKMREKHARKDELVARAIGFENKPPNVWEENRVDVCRFRRARACLDRLFQFSLTLTI